MNIRLKNFLTTQRTYCLLAAAMLGSIAAAGGALAENPIKIEETPELSLNSLRRELIQFDDRADRILNYYREEREFWEKRHSKLAALKTKGYASNVEVREAELNLKTVEAYTESYETFGEFVENALTSIDGASPIEAAPGTVDFRISLPGVTIDYAGIRLLSVSRPVDGEFAHSAYDFLKDNRDATGELARIRPLDARLGYWQWLSESSIASAGEKASARRGAAQVELGRWLGQFAKVRADWDLQRLEAFARHTELTQQGESVPCGFPVLSQPLFLDAGRLTWDLKLNSESIDVVLPIAAAHANHDGPILVAKARAADAARKLKWIKRSHDRGAASIRQVADATLAAQLAEFELSAITAEAEAKTWDLARLKELAPTKSESKEEKPESRETLDDQVAGLRSYWHSAARKTTVMLALARGIHERSQATAACREAELRWEWNQYRLAQHKRLKSLRASELERLESALNLAAADFTNAKQREGLRELELNQWMRAAELPRETKGSPNLPVPALQASVRAAQAKQDAAGHRLEAKAAQTAFQADLLAKLERIQKKGAARPYEVKQAGLKLELAQAKAESADREKLRLSKEGQLIAGLSDLQFEDQIDLGKLDRGTMQIVADLGFLHLASDPAVIAEMNTNHKKYEMLHNKLVDLRAKGLASSTEVAYAEFASRQNEMMAAYYRGTRAEPSKAIELVNTGLSLGELRPVSGISVE